MNFSRYSLASPFTFLALWLTTSFVSGLEVTQIKALVDHIHVTEDHLLYSTTKGNEEKELVAIIKGDPEGVLDLLSSDLTSRHEQSVITTAIASLDGEAYLKALAHGFRLYCDGKLSVEAINSLLMPPMNRYGFLAVNHNHPMIRDLLAELKSKMPSGLPVTKYVGQIIDGSAKSQAENYWGGNNLKPITPLSVATSSADAESPSLPIININGGMAERVSAHIFNPASSYTLCGWLLVILAIISALFWFVYKSRKG